MEPQNAMTIISSRRKGEIMFNLTTIKTIKAKVVKNWMKPLLFQTHFLCRATRTINIWHQNSPSLSHSLPLFIYFCPSLSHLHLARITAIRNKKFKFHILNCVLDAVSLFNLWRCCFFSYVSKNDRTNDIFVKSQVLSTNVMWLCKPFSGIFIGLILHLQMFNSGQFKSVFPREITYIYMFY